MNFAVLFLVINFLFFVAVAYYFLVMRRQMAEEKKEESKEREFQADKIEAAEHELKEELQDVRERANKILEESENIAKELIGELEKTLGKKHSSISVDLPSDDNFEVELGSLSNKLKSHYVVRIKNLLTSLEKYELQEAKKVEEFAREQQDLPSESLQSMRVAQLQKMHEKIERYKEEELRLFDKKVKDVIDMAAKEVIGHALTNDEQEEAIMSALRKAKEQHRL